jgi:hypothetical protein
VTLKHIKAIKKSTVPTVDQEAASIHVNLSKPIKTLKTENHPKTTDALSKRRKNTRQHCITHKSTKPSNITVRLRIIDSPITESAARTEKQQKAAAHLATARNAIFNYEKLNPQLKKEKKESEDAVKDTRTIFCLENSSLLATKYPTLSLNNAFEKHQIEQFFDTEPDALPLDSRHTDPAVQNYVSRLPIYNHRGAKIHKWSKWHRQGRFSWSNIAARDWMVMKWKQERQHALMALPKDLRDEELHDTWNMRKKGIVHPRGAEFVVLRRMGWRGHGCVLNGTQMRFLRHFYSDGGVRRNGLKRNLECEK